MNRVWLGLLLPFLVAAAIPEDEAETGKCLPPSVGDIVGAQLSGAVKAAIPSDWKAGQVRVSAHRVELEFTESGRPNRVALVAGSVQADGHGQRFSYRILEAASPEARKTLLTVSSIVDAAVPDASILLCEVKPRRQTRAQTLLIGFAEAAVILTAVLYAITRGRRIDSA